VGAILHEDYNTITPDTYDETAIRVLQWNCRGIIGKTSQLKYLITESQANIVILSETHLLREDNFHINGFITFRNDRRTRSGGVALLIDQRLHPSIVNIPSPTFIDTIACRIRCRDQQTLDIVSVYGKHSTWNSNTLKQYLMNFNQRSIVAGDFNAKHPLWGGTTEDRRGTKLLEAVEDSNLICINNGNYTRFGSVHQNPSAIDISFISSDVSLGADWTTYDDLMGSDHTPIFFELADTMPTDQPEPSVGRANLKKIDWTKFTDVLEMCTDDSTPTYEEFVEIIQNAILLSAPQISARASGKRPQPYWDDELTQLANEKRQACRSFQRNLSYVSFQIYKQKEEEFKTRLKEKKTQSWRNFCDSLNGDTAVGQLWRMARKFKNSNYQERDQFSKYRIDGDKFLTKIAPHYVAHHEENRRFIDTNPFIMEELEAALANTKDSSPGIDRITYSAIKRLPLTAKQMLIRFFNEFLGGKEIPESWKDIKIIPILKPGKPPSDSDSYRPIALMSCIRKTYETMLKNRIEWIVENKRVLPDQMSGFRKGMGTMDALSTLVNDIKTNNTEGRFTVACSLDVQGAYDNVQIPLLLDIMKDSQIPENLAYATYNLFHEKKYTVFDGDQIYASRTSWIGLPQGSSLSPLGFNIYVALLVKKLATRTKVIGFADDITMYSGSEILQTAVDSIQQNCNLVGQELAILGLNLCAAKTKVVVFCKNRVPKARPVRVGNRSIEYSKEMKILGMTFTKTLNWKPHIRAINQKVAPYINFLRSISSQKWGSHPNAMLTIYKSCIRSIIEYGTFIIDDGPDSTLILLDRLQWKCIRICTGMFQTTHTKSLEVIAGIEPLEVRRVKAASRFIIKRFSIESNVALASTSTNIAEKNTSLEIAQRNLTLQLRNCYTDLHLPCFKYDREIALTNITIDLSMLAVSQSRNQQEIQSKFRRRIDIEYTGFIILGTDGSKDETMVGFAVVRDSYSIITHKPSDETNIMIAELLAIYHALKYCVAQPNDHNFLIVTDSLSGLHMLSRTSYSAETPKIWFEIKKLALECINRRKIIKLFWVPSHRGIDINETADHYAKLAAEEGSISEYHLNANELECNINTQAIRTWQTQWNDSPMGRFAHEIHPKVNRVSWFKNFNLNRNQIVLLNRLMSNHSRNRAHLYRNNIVVDQACPCGHATKNINHQLFDCPLHINIRPRLMNKLIAKNIPPDIKKNLQSFDINIFESLCEFIIVNDIEI
jgi:ribonuclease HI/endonuclease/exonuclease/phosphatase (EEP) superfamily protein YafD